MSEHQIRRRWIKLWTQETIHGTTMNELTPEERGIWFPLLCLAGDSPVPGKICIAENIAYTDQQLATLLKCNIDIYIQTKETLIRVNKIKCNGDGVIEICNFIKYQGNFNQSDYMSRYMPKYRKRIKDKKENNVKLNNVKLNNVKLNSVKLLDKTRQDKNKDKTLALGNNLIDTSIVNPQVVKYNIGGKEPQQENIFTVYENNIGVITQMSAEILKNIEKEYSLEWFKEAVKIAVSHNVRKLTYIQTILERWKVDGFKVDTRKGKQEQKPRKLKSVQELD